MVNKGLRYLKKANMLNSKSIFVPENNGKQNPVGSYSTEYQKYVVCN